MLSSRRFTVSTPGFEVFPVKIAKTVSTVIRASSASSEGENKTPFSATRHSGVMLASISALDRLPTPQALHGLVCAT